MMVVEQFARDRVGLASVGLQPRSRDNQTPQAPNVLLES